MEEEEQECGEHESVFCTEGVIDYTCLENPVLRVLVQIQPPEGSGLREVPQHPVGQLTPTLIHRRNWRHKRQTPEGCFIREAQFLLLSLSHEL